VGVMVYGHISFPCNGLRPLQRGMNCAAETTHDSDENGPHLLSMRLPETFDQLAFAWERMDAYLAWPGVCSSG
jgi:hypothetical protein